MDEPIVANSVLPARREPLALVTADGLRLVGELALPVDRAPVATLVCMHPLPTHGGMMDSHVLRKMSWRLPALAGIAVLRFNTRGTSSAAGTSDGQFDSGVGEGLDLAAAVAEVQRRSLPRVWELGWSFGTDVILRHGLLPDVEGAILLSPPGRWSGAEDVYRWRIDGRPILALVPERDEFAPPADVQRRFAQVSNATVVDVPDAVHLWVGEKSVSRVLNEVVARLGVSPVPLPTTWDTSRGAMTRWSDL